ncbi:MAG: DUF1015 family protein [Gammaproteobacteria bacterium]|jgi:uncharacterized protein (DUF1015 family)|nr:DUF1015 family protein [Gammaproteobacteria bacterium]MDP6617126.1 DUF1015 family protein [Gammaproteobacteria bacterium]MDP6695764.1 DUF1015 family protein [Gammaproteobacteria bacterium]MDP7041528.1 DUF1015 family protein [Gammaproteobacteria bacterium]
MSLIRPFRSLRPVPDRAADVVAPPYDVLNTAEARERARGRSWSFLHISKPEIDLPEGADPYSAEVYAKGAENLKKQIDEGILIREAEPCLYVYRLRMDNHIQTGLVFTGSVAAYDENRIRKHEFTRPMKEDDRVRQITALNAQTGPVLLAYRSSAEVEEIINETTTGTPVYDLVADDGVGHTIWVIDNKDRIDRLSTAFEAMDALYIADGHHRSASASRVAHARNKQEGTSTGNNSWDYFLCVAFPHDETQILDYNRVIHDLNQHTAQSLLDRLGEVFTVTASAVPAKPAKPGRFGMYLDSQWYALGIDPDRVPDDDPVGRLDISLLQANIIGPLLGIDDPRTDDRIDFVGGIRGLGELEKRVNSGEMAVAFALYPTSMEALMAVADINEVMPPKSTWFEPKLADGLLSHVLD